MTIASPTPRKILTSPCLDPSPLPPLHPLCPALSFQVIDKASADRWLAPHAAFFARRVRGVAYTQVGDCGK